MTCYKFFFPDTNINQYNCKYDDSYTLFQVKLITDSKATSDLKIQELQEQLAASESSLKESAAKSLELENTHASLISDLKAKESENASIQADQEKKAQEIQTLSQAIGTVNNQLAAKVR